MKVKELDRTANVSWSPQHQQQIYLAVGTAAQQLDASFSTTASLELYALNLSDPSYDLEAVASIPSKQRFHSLTWGSHSQSAGTVVGGCDGGVIQVFNASKLINKEEALVSQSTNHTGPVRSLDFNAYQSNLLASASSDSEIFIWDLNTSKPMTPGSKSQPAEDILSIAWNKQVQHILASCFSTRCVVWDLRKNDSIIKITDGATRVRWNSVAWNPDVATQLCLSSEEDQSPIIQLWDLRFATSPLKTLEGHQRGVLSISWCKQDPDMLLSCSKDNRILCWNPNNTVPGYDIICEITSPNQWNFNVSWCPKNPALFVSSSFDGHVSIHSLFGAPQQVQTSNKIADSFPGMDSYAQATLPQQHQMPVDLRKPPKWFRRPVGASFGFGGKLVSFDTPPASHEPQPKTVQISQVITEPELIARSNQLEDALQHGYYSDFCLSKADSSHDSHDKEVWEFLAANFQSIPRYGFLSLLGFNSDDVSLKLSKYIGKPANARDQDIHHLSDQMSTLGRSTDTDSEDAGDGDNANSKLLGPDGYDHSLDSDAASAAFDAAISTTQRNDSLKSIKISTTDDTDGLISQALLLGNTEAAVELCLQDNRMADAIILAMTGGSELLAKTQYKYFQQCSGYLSSLISAVVTEDWTSVVRSCDLESWKEALAGAITHSNDEEFPMLCELLGERLEASRIERHARNAQLCYICAGNINKLVSSWLGLEKSITPNDLQNLVELVMLLKKAVELQGKPVEVSGHIAELLTKYASILASQGSLSAALSYLGTSTEETIVELRERLSCSLGQKSAYQAYPAQQTQQPTQRRFSGQPITQRTRTVSTGYPTSQTPQSYQQPPQSYQQPPQNYQQPPPPPINQFNNVIQSQPSSLQSPKFNLNPLGAPTGIPPVQQQAPPPPQATPGPPPMTGNLQNPSPGPMSGVSSRSKYVVDPSVQSGIGQFPSYNQPQSNMYPQSGFPPQQPSNIPGYASQPGFPIQNSNQQPVPGFSQPTGFLSGSGLPTQPSAVPPPSNFPPPNMSGPVSGFQNKPPGFPPQNSAPSAVPPTNLNYSQPGFPSQVSNPPVSQVGFPPQSSALPPSQPNFNQQVPFQPGSNQQDNFSPDIYNSAPPVQAAPGWNDPPVLGPPKNMQDEHHRPTSQREMSAEHAGTRKWKQMIGHHHIQDQSKPAEPAQQNPITHPLFGTDPQPPPAPMNGYQNQGYTNNAYNQQQFQNYQQPRVDKMESPPPKKPIPEEHLHLQTVFDDLAYKCTMAANNPQSKRKLDDVVKKLEILYDSLRENKLSVSTLQGLHQLIQLIQNGDYQNGLMLHTQMVSGPDFSQISSFMPGIKVLLQSALQLQVYI